MSMDLLVATRKRNSLPIGFMPGRQDSGSDTPFFPTLLEVQARKIVANPAAVAAYAELVQACAISPNGLQMVYGAVSNLSATRLAHFSRFGQLWGRYPDPVQPTEVVNSAFFNGTGEFLILLYGSAPWATVLYNTGNSFIEVPAVAGVFDRYVRHIDITVDDQGDCEMTVVGGNSQTGNTYIGGYMKRYRFDLSLAFITELSTPSELADQDWKTKAFYSLDGTMLTVLRDTNSYGPRRFYVYSRASDGTLTLQPNGLSEATADMAGSSSSQLVCNTPRDELVTFSNSSVRTMRVYRRNGSVYASYASANMPSIPILQQYYGLTNLMAYAMSGNIIVAKIENGQITPVSGLQTSSLATQNTMAWFGEVT